MIELRRLFPAKVAAILTVAALVASMGVCTGNGGNGANGDDGADTR